MDENPWDFFPGKMINFMGKQWKTPDFMEKSMIGFFRCSHG